MKKTIFFLSVIIIIILIQNCETNTAGLSTKYLPDTVSVNEYLFKLEYILRGQKYHLSFHFPYNFERDWEIAPDSIIMKSQKYVEYNFGKEYADTNITYINAYTIPEDDADILLNKHYLVFYNYEINISDYYTNLNIYTIHDSLGNIIDNEGIVNVKEYPDLGMPFKITHRKAVEIAINYNLNPGISPWIVNIYFDGIDNKYYWRIINQLDEWSGIELYIDPNSGYVVKETAWIA
jgi:hypothetical protein